MFQTDQSTASSTLPTPASAGTQGYFTNGNPASGVPATIVDADFLNMLMMELINVVEAAGLSPSKTTYTQVLSAIKAISRNSAILTDTGTANAYSATNPTPLTSNTWVDGVVQVVKIAHANTGASTYAPDGLAAIPIYGLGLQPLQGSELSVGSDAVLMRMTVSGVNSGNPVALLMECAGGAQQISPATASNHAVQLGQLLCTMTGNDYLKIPVVVGGAMRTLIIQWCTTSAQIAANSTGTVTWPLAFPNACLFATGSPASATASSNAGNVTFQQGSQTKTGGTLCNWGSISANAYVIAIGW